MQLMSLAEVPLGLSRDDIMQVMGPFVQRRVDGDDPEWDRILRKRKKRILRNNVRRMTLGWLRQHQRQPSAVIEEYTTLWDGG